VNSKGKLFSTQQTLDILKEAGLRIHHERLKVWHRRGFAPGNRVGKGNERSYTLKDLIRIGSLVFISRRVGQLGARRPEYTAHGLADAFAEAVYAVFQSGLDGGVARTAHVYVITEDPHAGTPTLERIKGDPPIRSVAEMYATGTATIMQPGYFALQLAAAVKRVCSHAAEHCSTPSAG
jgi:hypothetical protein